MSIISFKDRGPWGKSSWRGNTSGHVIKYLLDFFKPSLFCDPAEGSGTSRDVAKELGIEYVGLDLHSGFNLLKDKLVDRLPRPADFMFFHPPYADMIMYSGEQWGKTPHPDDLSRCKDVDEFMEKLHLAIMNIYEGTRPGGNYSVLIGDMRKSGAYYSFQSDIIRFGLGNLKSVVIKAQHNCVSDRKSYSNTNFIPIQHEYLLIFEKERLIKTFLEYSLQMSERLKATSDSTWRNVIRWAMKRVGGEAPLEQLYQEVSRGAPEKILKNVNWQAKVRQVLQISPEFVNINKGVWRMVAA